MEKDCGGRESIKNIGKKPGMAIYDYNPSYLGGGGKRIKSSKPAWAKV
jgi:hypothetical protein